MFKNPKIQYVASILTVMATSILCYMALNFISYQVVALILLVVVSILAIRFDIWPVLIAALLSALTLNFFFIPPRFTFHITASEDILLFVMYFLVAMVNAVLTHKIKVEERKARDKEEKENSIRLYNTLFNSLSHELKTPISTIIGAIDTLKENESTLTPQVKSTLLAEIEKAGHRLHRQVENLLHMSRLESGMLQVHKDWCDVNELIHMVMHKFNTDVQSRIRYNPSLHLPLFKLDIGLMEQVIYNIVNNAILYTPTDSPIYIRAYNNDEHCKIEIVDSGTGFPESSLADIFNPFFRLPDTKTGGSGLGLSIGKGFTEAHGGSLTVENLRTGGAQLTILIPSETSFLNYIKHE